MLFENAVAAFRDDAGDAAGLILREQPGAAVPLPDGAVRLTVGDQLAHALFEREYGAGAEPGFVAVDIVVAVVRLAVGVALGHFAVGRVHQREQPVEHLAGVLGKLANQARVGAVDGPVLPFGDEFGHVYMGIAVLLGPLGVDRPDVGDAVGAEAVFTLLFNDRDARAGMGRGGRGQQTGVAAADDHNVGYGRFCDLAVVDNRLVLCPYGISGFAHVYLRAFIRRCGRRPHRRSDFTDPCPRRRRGLRGWPS